MSLEFRQNVQLKEFTSWLVGGPAEHYCRPETEDEVADSLRFAHERGIPWCVLGGGSNVLIDDGGVRGLVIHLRKFTGVTPVETPGRLTLDCRAGTAKSELLKIFLRASLSPALFLAGLPGDVGGGVVMNAGVAEAMSPREFYEIVDEIEVMRWAGGGVERHVFRRDEIAWSYRHSEGWRPGIVVRARISWPLEVQADVIGRVREANKMRLSKQPLDMPSCGSVFMNPPSHKAAQLIDGCGLKGLRAGGAEVSKKHANFIVNVNDATAADIRTLIRGVKDEVRRQTGVELHAEVVELGSNPT